MTEDTPAPPPAASDAIEAALDEWYRIRTHNNRRPTEHECMRSAIAAYHAALPSEFSALKNVLAAAAHAYDGEMVGEMSESALAAITALEARLADAISVLKGYEQWEGALILDNDAWTATNGLPRVPQVHWDRLMELQERRNTVVHGAAHEAAIREVK